MGRRKGRWGHDGVCMNGAKPGASACFWVKGGAGVLVGPSVNQSINRSVGGGGRKVENGCSRYCCFQF